MRTGKSIGTESGSVVARVWGEGGGRREWRVNANRYKSSSGGRGDKNFLKLESGYGCTTLNMPKPAALCTLKKSEFKKGMQIILNKAVVF